MTRHDDPDTTTPIDTTTRQAPVVSTPAELDALPVGSIVLDFEGDAWQRVGVSLWVCTTGDSSRLDWTEEPDRNFTVLHVPDRDLLAEAEARGYERGKRDALTEAATALYADETAERGTTKALHHAVYAAWLLVRARAAETPGGAA